LCLFFYYIYYIINNPIDSSIMKKFILLFLILLSINFVQAQVAINNSGNAANTHAMLDISSNTKGILIPRFTTTERTNLAGSLTITEDGLTVYDTDTKSFWYWDGTQWVQLGAGINTTEDKDWFKVGTTNAPTDINDAMYHIGNTAIGKNTADYKLDIYENASNNVIFVNQDNPDETQTLRIAGTFMSEGPTPTSTGKIGVYTGLGGNVGNGTGYASLTGYETDINISGDTNKHAYGFVSDITGDNDGTQIGVYNYLHDTGGNGARYGINNYMMGSSNGIIFGYYNLLNYSGDGINFGHYYRIAGSGNGVQYGGFNRILNSGNGKQVGTVNEIKTIGASAHVGTINSLGAGITESNPSEIVPVQGDSDGKRVANINLIAGDGDGLHLGETNLVISSGSGNHAGSINLLGYEPVSGNSTNTTGIHVGIINNLADIGNRIRTGSINLIGAKIDLANPTQPIPVSGDSDAKRIGTANTIMGDGNGIHLTESNVILSTGDGKHMGILNVIGYDYINHVATNTAGDHFGTVNNLNDSGPGIHNGTFNVLGYDLSNNTEVNSDGIHIGSNNFLAGGQTGNMLQGLQIANLNTIIAKSDASNLIYGGRQYGNLNIIGRDLLNNPATFLNNGDGDHFGTYNEVSDLGNGTHVGSYNVVNNNGDGRHIAVYGEVDDDDNTAWAGMFKGYTTSKNQVSTINLWSSNEYNVWSNNNDDLNLVEAGFNPVNYQLDGLVEVKVIVRVSSASGSGNKFKLHAIKNGSDVTPITDADNWTWTETSTGKNIVESEWKAWNAGTDVWELHLTGITDNTSSMKITNVYVMIRPFQLIGKP